MACPRKVCSKKGSGGWASPLVRSHTGFQLIGDPPYPFRGLGGVQHGIKAPGGQRSQHGQQAGHFVVQIQSHRAVLYPLLCQRSTDALHGLLHLSPCQRTVLIPEGGVVGPAGSGMVQQFQKMFHDLFLYTKIG